MFLLFSVEGNVGEICALPLDFVINKPANQFDFRFENVFLFYKFQPFLISIFFGPSFDHIKQNIPSNLQSLFIFLYKPWYIKSKKKNRAKKKNRPGLPTLFQIKKKIKKKKNRKSTYLPCFKFSSNSKHTYFFFWP